MLCNFLLAGHLLDEDQFEKMFPDQFKRLTRGGLVPVREFQRNVELAYDINRLSKHFQVAYMFHLTLSYEWTD